jgi:hypothetical protein
VFPGPIEFRRVAARTVPLLACVITALLIAPVAAAQRGETLPGGADWLAATDSQDPEHPFDAWPEAGLYDLKLPSIDRTDTLRLSGYRGKKVLLIQFASW